MSPVTKNLRNLIVARTQGIGMLDLLSGIEVPGFVKVLFYMGLGVAVGVVVTSASSLLTSARRARHLRFEYELRSATEQALESLPVDSARAVIAELQQQYVEQLERSRKRAEWISAFLSIVMAIGGLIGLAIFTYKVFSSPPEEGKSSWLLQFISPAHAANGLKSDLAPMLPYIASGVLMLMGIAFIVSLSVLLTLKDTKENQARIKAADSIVKTFGGFFTGLATTLLK